MMVLQDTTDGRIYPADRCTWVEDAYANGNYSISSAVFYTGATGASGAAVTISVASPLLGAIGKSGRFVGFTV